MSSTQTLFTPEDVLSYWFGDVDTTRGYAKKNDVLYIKSRLPFWFGRNEAFEKVQLDNKSLILEMSGYVRQAIDKGTDFMENLPENWNSPRGLLALVILFDQFPRSVFRATADAFAFDPLAVKCSLKAIKEDIWKDYAAIERLFLIVDIQHAEDLSLQQYGMSLAPIVGEHENEEVQEFFRHLTGFPKEHHDVIVQFGRFPGRNAVLGRESTPEEIAWLNSPDCPGWAKSQQPPKA